MSYNILEDAYKQYREAGFILHRSAKHKKHAYRKGSYEQRENEEYEETATGYVGIIPPRLIIVDNDRYKDDGESMKKFLKDLQFDETPEPFAITPSGGEHYAFFNPYEDLVIGDTKDYPNLDIYAGYQSVIPIVGTTVLNKQNELASYRWASFDDSFVINPFNNLMVEKLNMRKRTGGNDNDYDDLTLAIKEQEMPLEEVKKLLKEIPIEEFRYDTGYLTFAMAMYDRFEGCQEGLKLFQETCTRYPDNHPEMNEQKWNSAHFKPTRGVTFKTLRSLANSGVRLTIEKALDEAKSNEDFERLISTIQSTPKLNTPSKLDQTVREELSVAINLKMKEVKKKDPNIKIIQARTLLPALTPEKPKGKKPEGTQLYLCQGKFVIQHNKTIVKDVSTQMLGKYLKTFGIDKTSQEALQDTLIAVEDVKEIPDYLIESESVFAVEPNKGTRLPSFVVRNNPLTEIKGYLHDEEILNDFLNNIWNGKIDDIVKLLALTIKTKEQKLNRLMLVAPSNTGKTELFTMLTFQKITMKRLLNGMRGDKGVGSAVIEGIRKSALLLIDEANTSLEAEIKDMDKELHVDQFGSGGTQVLPLHFTALTSTHKTATRNNSDELYNRFLQVELTGREVKHTLMQSDVFLKNTEKYTNVVRGYVLTLFKDTILGPEGKEELRVLQEKYRLPRNNDLDTLLLEISEAFISETKRCADSAGDIIIRGNDYYYKRKGDVSSFIEDRLGEIPSLDVGKYSELLVNHFVDDKRVSLKIEGSALKFYKINMLPYCEDIETMVLSQFDDLDTENL